jgi:hypothetical protein
MNLNNPALFFPLFVAFWCSMCFALSFLSGWRALAKHYRATQPFAVDRWRFRSASISGVSYGGTLTLGADEQGLFISVMFPFRLGHPPLFIPWSEVHSVGKFRQLFLTMEILHFLKAPSVVFKVSQRLARAVSDKSHGRFSLINS